MDSPQKSEKFASIWLNDVPPTWMGADALQYSGRNAFLIRSVYDTWRPAVPGALRAAATVPSTLSLGSTRCLPSGTRGRSLRATNGQVRPSHDISTPLRPGPVACEARLANGMSMLTCCAWLPTTFQMRASG